LGDITRVLSDAWKTRNFCRSDVIGTDRHWWHNCNDRNWSRTKFKAGPAVANV